MTTGPAASRLQDKSLVSIGAGLVAVVAAGYISTWAGFSQPTATGVMAVAIGVPAAVELHIKNRRRDTNVDVAHIQRGELRRPVGLVVMLLAAAIVLLDSAIGFMLAGISSVLILLVEAGTIDISTAEAVNSPLVFNFLLIFGMCLFLVASYASHYFAKRPYLWTATAVVCALAIRELVVLALRSTSEVKSLIVMTGGSLARLLVIVAGAHLGFLFICMVGVWLARCYHDEFLAKKLARMEGKAARDAASAQDSSAPQNSAPKSVTPVSRPNDLPSAPDNHRIWDSFEQIEKLAHLRDTGALTEEEFQAKKSEVLGRI